MPTTGNYEGFTQPFGAISVGKGRQVLPAPEIRSFFNPLTRGYDDRTFRWDSYQANPIGVSEDSGVIPIQLETPSSFILEITPDLGWHNKEALFEPFIASSSDVGNSLVKRFTNLTIGVELTNESTLDTPVYNQISYAMPLADFKSVIDPQYKEYLWRVIAVRSDGIESFPSIIQRFQAQVSVLSFDWTIDNKPKLNGLTVTLGGTKTPQINRIEVDGFTGYTTISSTNQWSAEFPIRDTGQEFSIRAIDVNNNTSEYKKVKLSLPKDQQTYNAVWNHFDEIGMLVDLKRIPAESNTGYKARILDTYVHRSSPRYNGLINGIARELDIAYDDAAFTVQPGTGIDQEFFEGINLSVGEKYIYVDADVFQQTREHHTLDPWDWSVTLNSGVIESNLIVESPIGTEIKSRNTWTVYDNKVVFNNNDLLNQPIYVTYRFQEKYDRSTGTVKDVGDWLAGRTWNSARLLNITTGSTVDTGSAGSYLALMPRTPVIKNLYLDFGGATHTGLPIRWTNAKISNLSDDEFQDVHKNKYNNHFGTKVDTWATFLQSYIHTQWGFLIADRNVWSKPDDPQNGRVFLETNYDPHFAHWESSSPRVPIEYTPLQAHAYNYMSPTDGSDMKYKGLPSSLFKSGIGYGTDLLVRITKSDTEQLSKETREFPFTIELLRTEILDVDGNPVLLDTGILPIDGVLTI